MTRTGSRCSRVGPAVTTTVRPARRPPATSNRAAAARIASGSLMRPGRSLGPSASAPVSGPMKCQPRAASVFRLASVAGCAYIASFMAGAASTGPHQLVQGARGELLLQVDRAVARELVHEFRELGGDQHAQVLVLGLRGDFAGGHNAHVQTFCKGLAFGSLAFNAAASLSRACDSVSSCSFRSCLRSVRRCSASMILPTVPTAVVSLSLTTL